MKKIAPFAVAVLVFSVACGEANRPTPVKPPPTAPPVSAPPEPTDPPAVEPSPAPTAVPPKATPIPCAPGTDYAMKIGGKLACFDCHGSPIACPK